MPTDDAVRQCVSAALDELADAIGTLAKTRDLREVSRLASVTTAVIAWLDEYERAVSPANQEGRKR